MLPPTDLDGTFLAEISEARKRLLELPAFLGQGWRSLRLVTGAMSMHATP